MIGSLANQSHGTRTVHWTSSPPDNDPGRRAVESMRKYLSFSPQIVSMPITYYGIDVSKDLLHIAYPNGCDATGQPQWGYQKLSNEIADIEQWATQLPAHCQIIFEHTGTYSARYAWILALLNQPFSILTPGQSKGFAATLKSISKTDRSDALMLARYGQALQPALTKLADETLHQLRQRHKHFNDLKVSHQGLSNQLHALSYDPRASSEVKSSLLTLSESYQAQITLFENDGTGHPAEPDEPGAAPTHQRADATRQGYRSCISPGTMHGD